MVRKINKREQKLRKNYKWWEVCRVEEVCVARAVCVAVTVSLNRIFLARRKNMR